MGLIDENLLQRIREDKEIVVMRGASDAEIDDAQNAVGVRFPPSYIEFLRLFNGGEIRHLRLFRIGEDKMVEGMNDIELSRYLFVGDLVGPVLGIDDSIVNWQGTEEEKEASRHTNSFFEGIHSRRYFPFGDDHGGNWFCFDLTQKRDDGEYPILQWDVVAWDCLPEWRANSFANLLADAYSD